jgi:exopolyphosphatase/guanosine-5'-triphosphate,3'-diphosphate pyrophosphatase
VRSWTLPLGALRLSDRFLKSDPPRPAELARLREHVEKTFRKAGVPHLAADERLIGTGGSIRNIAKIVARARRDALSRVHGSILPLWRVRDLSGRASHLRLRARASIPGLNKDRADTIVGGFLTVQTAMQLLGGDEILVSAQGLREGLALATLDSVPPLAPEVRRASVAALAERFATWRPEAAQRRARIGEKLLGILVKDPSPLMRELLRHTCTLLDIGHSVDYYDRYRNTANILAASDLRGFSARGIALMWSILQQAANSNARPKRPRRPLRPKDLPLILSTAAILSLADEIERRCLPGQPLHVRFRITPEELVLTSEALAGWKVRAVGDRFHHAFGLDLRIEGR